MSDQDSEKTRLIRRSSRPLDETPPPPAGSDPEETRYVGRGGQPAVPDATRIIGRGAPAPPPPSGEGHTVLVRPSSRQPQIDSGGGEAEVDASAFSPEGPVVGWLVVVEGPGRGRSIELGYGMNPIGRDADNRVSLPFGDEQISRKKHATLTYDPRGRKYYLQHGESSNLTYIGVDPVLAPAQLNGGETIRLGDSTELRFIPLCGEDFDWEEEAADTKEE